MNTVEVYATRIGNKIELFVDSNYCRPDTLYFAACRIKFKESNREPYTIATVGSGLLTMSIEQAKELRDNLIATLNEKTV